MTQDEILSAAKEAGCNDEFIKMAPCWLEAFAKIIERKTIERCAALVSYEEYDGTKRYCFDDPKECVEAIRKLGEE